MKKYFWASLLGHIVVFLMAIILSLPYFRLKKFRELEVVRVYTVEMPKLEELKPKKEIKAAPKIEPAPEPERAPKKVIEKPEPTPKPKVTPPPVATPKPTPEPVRKLAPTPKPTPKRQPTPIRTERKPPIPTPLPRRIEQPRAILPTPRATLPRPLAQPPGPVKLEASELPAFYLEAVRMRIESNFSVPPHLKNTPAQCVLQFVIFRDGRIGNIRILKSAGSQLLDGLALQALEKTGQLGPLPDTFPRLYITVMLTFDFSL